MTIESLSKPSVALQLRDWIEHGATAPLEEGVYATTVTRDPALFDLLREAGVVAVLPAVSDSRVAAGRRTPLGVLAHSLLDAFGLTDELCSYALAHLVPYCSRCGCSATAPGTLDKRSIPAHGFISLSVVDDESGAALSERCEWLGSERVLVGDRLVSVADIISEDGEPVLTVVPVDGSDTSLSKVHSEAERWFGRGGGELRVVHFASRGAHGEAIGVLSGRWACAGCSRSFTEPTRAQFDQAPPCATCQGSGWLSGPDGRADERADGRLCACRDCDGFGVTSEIADYRVHGVSLRHIAALTFGECLAHFTNLPKQLRGRLESVGRGGFARYPLGAPVGLLSPGERGLCTIVSGELSGFTGARYLVDAALEYQHSKNGVARSMAAACAVARPERVRPQGGVMTAPRDEDVVLREIRLGCLDLAEVRFPLGTLSVVAGPVGSGKSLLLSTIAARFAKRRKVAHHSSFGLLSRCCLVSAERESDCTVLEALGVADEFAHEIARTRKAQELGLIAADLVLPSSRYRCQGCASVPRSVEPCSECLGALYDWRIAELDIAGVSVRERLTTPVQQLAGVMWASDRLERLARDWSDQIGTTTTFATKLSELDLPERRFIAVWGGVASVVSRRVMRRGKTANAPRAGELVLIDGPRVMPPRQALALEKLLREINEMGATVIYADIPEGLESLGHYVLQLQSIECQYERRMDQPWYDTRYARLCSATDS